MGELKFFDANCTIGRRKKAYSFSVTEKKDIRKELERCNIIKAVCHHTTAREYNALEGNRILMEEIGGDNFFLPAYVMVPDHAGDFLPFDELKKELKENDVRLIKMFPARGEQSFSLAKWDMEDSFQFLSDIKMPLMLTFKNVSADDLHQILSSYPELKIIVTDTSYFFDKELMRLMQLNENLYLETSNYTTLDGIEYITRKFGAERLIFGSGAPFVSTGAAVAKILYAKISDVDKEKIAHGNLENLMRRIALK